MAKNPMLLAFSGASLPPSLGRLHERLADSLGPAHERLDDTAAEVQRRLAASNLNASQQAAVRATLLPEACVQLVHGPPGTGGEFGWVGR